MASIKQIDGHTVHQIQSGQVIVDLSSVVKELVENSIDSGASNIDVRFKNQGLDLIEVQDNGTGISPANYHSIALKHHTSKLSSYADICSLETFGFRGEALASLCALSTLNVTTCLAEDAPKGSRLTFDISGRLKGTSIVAAQRGTTVVVEKLFHNLPVRRRELERNIKREWHKVIALLNQYACIQTGVKFSVSQQPTKGRRIVLFSTKGNPTTRDNIINIFGAKTMAALAPLDMNLEMQPSTLSPALQRTVDPTTISKDVRIIGHVSRPAHGDGRQTPDRQMFFINGRPCGLPQFAKIFNEVYRSYNSIQSPFIFADIRLDTHLYDVNVSPDKRTILLHDQNRLLDNIRTCLVEIFDSHDYSVHASLLTAPKQNSLDKKVPDQIYATASNHEEIAATESPSDASSATSHSSEDDTSKNENTRNGGSTNARTRSRPGTVRGRDLLDQWVLKKSRAEELGEPRTTSAVGGSDHDEDTLSEVSRIAKANTHSGAARRPVSSSSTICSEDDKLEQRKSVVNDFDQETGECSRQTSKFPEEPAKEATMTDPISPAPSTGQDRDQNTIPAVQPLKNINLSSNVATQPSPSRQPAGPPNIVIGRREDPEKQEDLCTKLSRKANDTDVDSEPQKREFPSFGECPSQNFSARGYDRLPTSTHGDETQPMTRASSAGINEHPFHAQPTREDSNSEDESDSSTPLFSNPVSSLENDESGLATDLPTNNLFMDGDMRKVASPRLQRLAPASRRGDATLQSVQKLNVSEDTVQSEMRWWLNHAPRGVSCGPGNHEVDDITAADAESKLSLIITKSDFPSMRVAGQFNMGFIIAVRPSGDGDQQSKTSCHDELFIIDQHASDEKYNFERLQDTTVVQSQRLVHPKRLELTALEEEIVMQNMTAIEANGFKITVNVDGEWPVGSRCQLTALPLSRETTFSIMDLEELISLLGDESSESQHIPRPSKVRKMFAMRACRSSIMIGKALTQSQMYTLVTHMGELDKPWNCPHGRPTMRHLCGMQTWDDNGWSRDLVCDPLTSWSSYGQDGP